MKIKVKIKLKFCNEYYDKLIFQIKFPGDWFYNDYIPKVDTPNNKHYANRPLNLKEILEVVHDMDKIKGMVKEFVVKRLNNENKCINQDKTIANINTLIKTFNKNKMEFEIEIPDKNDVS